MSLWCRSQREQFASKQKGEKNSLSDEREELFRSIGFEFVTQKRNGSRSTSNADSSDDTDSADGTVHIDEREYLFSSMSEETDTETCSDSD